MPTSLWKIVTQHGNTGHLRAFTVCALWKPSLITQKPDNPDTKILWKKLLGNRIFYCTLNEFFMPECIIYLFLHKIISSHRYSYFSVFDKWWSQPAKERERNWYSVLYRETTPLETKKKHPRINSANHSMNTLRKSDPELLAHAVQRSMVCLTALLITTKLHFTECFTKGKVLTWGLHCSRYSYIDASMVILQS